MWISQKRWKRLEERVAELEKAQIQPLKIERNAAFNTFKKEIEREMKRNGKPLFNY